MSITIGFVALVFTAASLLVPPLYFLYQYRVSIQNRIREIVSQYLLCVFQSNCAIYNISIPIYIYYFHQHAGAQQGDGSP